MKESKIREVLDARVRAYGGETRAVAWLGRKNAPDVLCLFSMDSRYSDMDDAVRLQGRHLHPFVETKKPGKNATAAQAREHERMRAAGCVVFVITTLEELDAWLSPL